MLKFFVYWIICLFAYLFIPLSQAVASGEFQADYDVDYSVAPSGTTIVTQNVTLTNLQTNLYPKQYSVTIDTTKIQNVIARDTIGIISPKITQTDGKTEIILSFNSQIVGVGKQLGFTLRYENLDVAQKNGNIWEINIPGITGDPDIASYIVSLEVPGSFGPNAYAVPLPASGRKWNKAQMTAGGISAAYGKEQIFSLDLTYFLENIKLTPVYEEIALPPDTAFQKITIKELSPRPTSVRRDDDGNWIARYDLGGAQSLSVKASVLAQISLDKRDDWKEPPSDPSIYLKPLEYWNTNDPTIVELAKKYTTPRAIYHYIVETLGYDYKRVTDNPIRKGAAEALKTPNESVCMEFTDLFVAMTRAAGIPARESVGYAYTTNSKLRPLSLVADVLHAWPEYFDRDRGIWVPVDPTWGSTTGGVNYFDKLDFNHIVFAVHGLSSSIPYPAGFYRQKGKATKDVNVKFIDSIPGSPSVKLKTTIEFPKTTTAGLPTRGSVTVENTSGVLVGEATTVIQITPSGATETHHDEHVPPFAKFVYPIEAPATSYLTQGQGRITVRTNDEITNFTYEIRPMYWLFIPVAGAFIVGFGALWYVVSHKTYAKPQKNPR